MSLIAYALTTVDRFKDFIDRDSFSATEESVVENTINAVTNYIESYCGRRFMQTAYSDEEYDGPAEEQIVLKNWPVDSAETFTVEYRDSAQNEDDWETLDSEYYFVNYDSGIIYGAGRDKFVLARRRYRVSYTAGYDFDNSSTYLSDTEAGDVELVAWRLVANIWHSRKGRSDIKSEKIGDYAVAFGNETGELDEFTKTILDHYKRIESVSYLTPIRGGDDSVFQP